MTTEREKIIQLARECGLIGYYLKQDDFIEAFYHKAQAEAFEAAASRCDVLSCTAAGCAATIREMAKEVK